MNKNKSGWTGSWRERLARYVAGGRRESALRLLSRIIENDLPLFRNVPELSADRRAAWQIRTNLLREWGRPYEALAWVCFQEEVCPGDVTAAVLKRRIRSELGLDLGDDRELVEPENQGMWPGVAGMRELKAILERDVIFPLQEPDLYHRYRVSLPNGVMLYGPPGCGKTFIARKLGERIGFSFHEVKPSTIGSTYIHGTQQKIAECFQSAESNAPAILFFDEIEAMVPDRSSDSFAGRWHATEVNEFLTQLNECSSRGILVVGATNDISKIDRAVLRPGRFDKKVFIDAPDFEARTELFRNALAGRPQRGIDLQVLADWTKSFTCAEIELVVNEAAREALARRVQIDMDHLTGAIAHNPAQFTEEELRGFGETR